MPLRVLIADTLHPGFARLFAEAGIVYDYCPEITREELRTALPGFDGLVIRSKTRVDADLLANANIRFVARAGAGIDNLDEAWLTSRGIRILNAPEGNRDAVGEHTTGMILSLLHNLHRSHQEVTNGIWQREANRGYELGSMTVGIVGLGNTGSALAHKLQGFGCRIIAYDKYLTKSPLPAVPLVPMQELFEQADILSLHIPLTDETRAMANYDYFKRFRQLRMFVNTSRGEIAPLADLARALTDGLFEMAALDVLEDEKLTTLTPAQQEAFDTLKASGRVLFTPHIAGWTHESYVRINEVLVKKIAALENQLPDSEN
ncbi:MAG TPA: phosphoglycerate dehydrogenase [Flammeovirgaceae bacterium]|nr:phosphoglycerate dehydrogenase [Flammeovirgaceae bacterium]